EARLNRLGIHTIRDLLWHLPFRYIDRERIASVAGVSPGERVTLWGEITRLTMRPTRRRPLWLVRGRLTDGTGEIELGWFVRAYGQTRPTPPVQVREEGVVTGRVVRGDSGLEIRDPVWEESEPNPDGGYPPIPVYPTTEGISQKRLREWIAWALEHVQVQESEA